MIETFDDALGHDDATGLAQRLRRGEVSASELHAAALARARAVNPALNAVASWAEDAPVGDAEAPFAGVPSLVKDNEDLAGSVTGFGSRAVPDRIAVTSSPFVTELLSLGLAPIAKTTLSEFGLTATTETSRHGATRNPLALGRSAGGSSGGSAALVAAGVVPIAHANDGGGSIRIPASCCGLVGLKPSRGRLVDHRYLERLPLDLTVQGVLTRSVRDTAAFYAAAEQRYRNPALPPVGRVDGPGKERLRIGLVREASRGLPVAPDVVQATDETARLLEELGHRVEEIAPPVADDFGPDFLRYWGFLAFALTRGGRLLFGRGFDPSRCEPFTLELARFFLRRAERFPASLRRLRTVAAGGGAVPGFDIVLSPVLAHEPARLGQLGADVGFHDQVLRLLRYSSFTPLQNVTGAPAISLPLGLSATGLPVGVQLGAALGQERRLLELAFELETTTLFRRNATSVR